MDAIAFWWLPLAALVGGIVSFPLLAVADRLLQTVPPAEAAPADLRADTGAPTTVLPTSLGRGWRWTMRLGLVLAGPAAVARTALRAPTHLPVALGGLTLFVCLTTLVLVAVIDSATHLVFVEVIAPPVVAVFGLAVAAPGAWPAMFTGGALAGAGFLALFALGRALYGGEALGFGDVQLAAAFGALLGWRLIPGALLLGMLALAGVALSLVVARRANAQTFLPVGAFLAFGAAAALLLNSPPWW